MFVYIPYMHIIHSSSIILPQTNLCLKESNELKLIRSSGNWFQSEVVLDVNKTFNGFFLEDAAKLV